jgi:di/tricarboxylate transporter
MLITIIILAGALILFISGRIRMDLVGLMVMVSLAISGVLTPSEALSGFSAPAVVTIWAVFIISGGLTRSGLAAWLGRRLLYFAGNDELRILFLLMVLAAIMSYTMNTIGVVAMLMPVVMDITRQRHQSPSRFLLPVVHASLLGGMATLFGTPSNLLANEALVKFGYPPFHS